MQGLGRIAKMHAETLSDFQTIYDKFRMPSLVITVVGEWIKHVLAARLAGLHSIWRGCRYILCRALARYPVPYAQPHLDIVMCPAAGDGRDRETLSPRFHGREHLDDPHYA